MNIGYLHIGPEQHGVCRHGRLIASAVGRKDGVDVEECAIRLSDDERDNQARLIDAGRRLSAADLVHLQYTLFDNRILWGNGMSQYRNVRAFASACKAPLVVTLHDVNPFHVMETVVKPAYRRFNPFRRREAREALGPATQASGGGARPRGSAAPVVDRGPHLSGSATPTVDRGPHLSGGATPAVDRGPHPRGGASSMTRRGRNTARQLWDLDLTNWLTLRYLTKRSCSILFCTKGEMERIRTAAVRRRAAVIPLPVEDRSLHESPGEAKKRLGLADVKTVTMLGFIHKGKGYQIMVDAMRHLADNVCVVFAGGASDGGEGFVNTLVERAKHLGVEERLRITNYLPEDELERYMIATDLAVCPFETMSGSASLAAWVSADRPVLSSYHPQIDELNAYVPGAIHTFQPYEPQVLAREVDRLLQQLPPGPDPNVARLHERLQVSNIADEHIEIYRAAAGSERNPNG